MASCSACSSCQSELTQRYKLLQCLHPVCTDCLEQLIRLEDNCIKCRRCQAITPSPGQGRSHYLTLPTCRPSSGAEARAGDTGRQDLQEEGEQIACDNCTGDTLATSVCQDCSLDLCEEHAASHVKKRKFAHHRVVSAANGRIDGSSGGAFAAAHGFGSSSSSRCPVHVTQNITHYCRACEDVACSVCLRQTTHGQHGQALVTIQGAAQESREQIQALCSETSHGGCRKTITDKVEMLQTMQDGIKDSAAELSKQITEEFGKKIERLKTQMEKLLGDVDQLQLQKCLPIGNCQTKLTGCLEVLDKLQEVAASCDGDYAAVRVCRWIVSKTTEISATAAEDLAEVSTGCDLMCTQLTGNVTVEDIGKIGCVFDASEMDPNASTVQAPETAQAGEQFTVSVSLVSGYKTVIAKSSPLYRNVSFSISGPEEPRDTSSARSAVCDQTAAPVQVTNAAGPGEWQCRAKTPGKHFITVVYGEMKLCNMRPLQIQRTLQFDPEACECVLQFNGARTVATCCDEGAQRNAYSTPITGNLHVRLKFACNQATMRNGIYPLCGIVPDSTGKQLPMLRRTDGFCGVGSNGNVYGRKARAEKWPNKVDFTLLIDCNQGVFEMQWTHDGEPVSLRWTGIPPKVRIQVGLYYTDTSFSIVAV